MLGSTLALTNRTLRQDIRSLYPHLLRFFLVSFVSFMIVQAHAVAGLFGAPGMQLFRSVMTLNLWFLTISSLSLFGSAITEEKEERTIGLLRMAGISPVALLLGKAAPRFMGTVFMLLVQVPFTLLAITLGGVALRQVLAAYVALIAYALALGTLGLLFSVVCRTTRRAAWWTGVCVVAFFSSASLVGLIAFAFENVGWISPGDTGSVVLDELAMSLRQASVSARLGSVMSTGFATPIFGIHFYSNLIAAAVFFLASWLLFDRFVTDEHSGGVSRGLLPRSRARLRWLGTGRATGNALIWKDFHFLFGGRLHLMLRSLFIPAIVAFSLAVTYASVGSWRSIDLEVVGGYTVIIALIATAGELAGSASRLFGEEIKQKTLANLMMLPISTPHLVAMKVAGALVGLIPGFIYFNVGMFVWIVADGLALDRLGEMIVEPGFWLTVTTYFLFLHLTVLFSLVLRWGALPLAAIVVIGTMFMCISCIQVMPFTGAVIGGRRSVDAFLVFFTMLELLIIAMIQSAIVSGLRRAASR